jgi:RimJ/RimL family protein N-acetyltransferase
MRPEPRLLHGHDEQVAEWVSKTLPDHDGFASDVRSIGIFDAGGSRILAGVVYHDYRPAAQTCAMTIASESPMFATKGTIRALLSVPFEQFGCFKVWATTRAGNAKAQRFLSKVGFVREGILRHQFGPKDHAWFYGMTKPEFAKLYGG